MERFRLVNEGASGPVQPKAEPGFAEPQGIPARTDESGHDPHAAL